MELPLDIHIRAKQRDGFRSASAAYILKSMPRTALNDKVDDVVDASDEHTSLLTRRDAFARRLGITGNVSKDNIGYMLDEMLHIILPNELNETEIRLHPGIVDMQSIICTVIAMGGGVREYSNILHDVFKRVPRVIYTPDATITSTRSSAQGGLELTIVSDKSYLNYLTTPEDKPNSGIPSMFYLHSKLDSIEINALGTLRDGIMDFAFNMSTNDDLFVESVEIMMSTDHVRFGDIIVPFVIENEGLLKGCVIIHLFLGTDGSSLAKWMDYSNNVFNQMLVSVVNTLGRNAEAFYSPGLGGQFPVDFFLALRGTIAFMTGEFNYKRISDGVAMKELFLAYKNSSYDGSLDQRTQSIFRNKNNLELFLTRFLSFLISFNFFESLVNYNKLDDRGVMMSREKRLGISNNISSANLASNGLSKLTEQHSLAAKGFLSRIAALDDQTQIFEYIIDSLSKINVLTRIHN